MSLRGRALGDAGRTVAEWSADWRILLLLPVVTLAVFGASVDDGFHFDDELILEDSNVSNPDRWSHFLNPLYPRQVTFFSFYLNHLVGGEDPAGYHLVNIALHSANGMLLYLLLGPLLGGWTAVAAALVFLVHPVQTESVVYVYQRSTLLAAFFSLGALLVVRSCGSDAEARPGPLCRAGVVALFALAAASKESALAVPLVLALLIGVRHRTGRAILAVVALGAVATLGLLARLGEETVGIGVASRVDPWTYFLTQSRVLYTYLRLLVVPYPQALEYDVTPASSLWDPVIVAGLGGVALLLWASAGLLRSPRFAWAGVGATAFFVLLAPTSSVIPSADFAFEHRLYLPLLGFAVFAAFWLSRIRARTGVLVVLVVAWSALSVNRGRAWASDVTLWEDSVRKAPGKARAWFNLGGAYMEAGDPRAADAFRRALGLDPDLTEAVYDLGVVEQRLGNLFAALAWYERALAIEPDYWPAINNLGNVRLALDDYPGASDAFSRVLVVNPDYWPAEYNLALAYTAMNRPDLAVGHLRTVLDWSPDFTEARYLLAVSLERLGESLAASLEFEKIGDDERAALRSVPQLPAIPADR